MASVVTPRRRRNEGFPYLSIVRVDDDDVDWRRSKGVFLIIVVIVLSGFFFVRRRCSVFLFFLFVAENYSPKKNLNKFAPHFIYTSNTLFFPSFFSFTTFCLSRDDCVYCEFVFFFFFFLHFFNEQE